MMESKHYMFAKSVFVEMMVSEKPSTNFTLSSFEITRNAPRIAPAVTPIIIAMINPFGTKLDALL